MEKEFIPYEQALDLKELGFDEPCFGKFYHNHLEIGGSWLNSEFNKDKKDGNIFTSAPLYQQVFRWFREKYNAHIYPQKFTENTWHVSWGDWESPVFETYEEAELECVNFLITTLK
jgi:ABC-type glycerol-3-phosphate transport system substrate-binding protein